jgi:cell division septation protein DedD
MQAHLCQEAFAQCQSANAADAQAQRTKCVEGIQSQCGTLDIGNFKPVSSPGIITTTSKATPATTKPATTTKASAPTQSSPNAGALVYSAPTLAAGGLAVLMAVLFGQMI